MPKPTLPLSFSLLLVAGCVVRPLPTSFPPESAAAVRGQAVPSAELTVALDSDPPLPGEPLGGWFGLAPSTAARPTHDHGGAHAE